MLTAESRAPVLTKVYRCGPGRQRIRKGYVLWSPNAEQATQALSDPGSPAQAAARSAGMTIQTDARIPHALWLDTGSLWLHTTGERERLLGQLGRVVTELSQHASAAGALLLPNAVRLQSDASWLTCGDEHSIETTGDAEQSTFCNLVRRYLPELIALTGRAGAGPEGIEQLGSRRLADSDRHITAREFKSLAPSYLSHVVKSLIRDEGVRRLDLLDIVPITDATTADGRAWVDLRFVDGQASFRTTMAHAILFEALLIRARRMVAQGKSAPAVAQSLLDRNRSYAIAHGLEARLESKNARQRPRQGNGRSSDKRENGKPKPIKRVALRTSLLKLLSSLEYEFQALEVVPHELSPLLLGLSLRDWGVSGIQNENDLLKLQLGDCPPEAMSERVSRVMLHSRSPDMMSSLNRQHFRQPTQAFETIWRERLEPHTTPAPDEPAKTATTTSASSADQGGPRPPPKSHRQQAHKEQAHTDQQSQVPQHVNKPGPQAAKRAKLRDAMTRLTQRLTSQQGQQPVLFHNALREFASASGANDIARGLKVLQEEDAKRLLGVLTEQTPIHELRSDVPKSWTWNAADLAGVRRQTQHRAIVRLTTSLIHESSLDSAVQKLLNSDLSPWSLLVVDRRRDDGPEAPIAQRDLLLVRPTPPPPRKGPQ